MIWGGDISLDHGAVVDLRADGELEWAGYVASAQSAVHGWPWGEGVWFPRAQLKKHMPDPHGFNLMRLAWWAAILADWHRTRNPVYVAVEDYAMSARSNSTYQIGEQGGLFRWLAWVNGAAVRLHDNGSVKKFAAHHGGADAQQVVDAVADRWWPELRDVAHKQSREDLGAAYAVARLYWTELMVRRGDLSVADLEPPERQIFHRVTDYQPLNLLSRSLICADAELPAAVMPPPFQP